MVGLKEMMWSTIRVFVSWYDIDHLCLNFSKEMVIDLQRQRTMAHTPVNIQGIDIVKNNKLNSTINWTGSTDALHTKGQSNLHLLRRQKSFGACRPLLRTFYDSVMASAFLSFCLLGSEQYQHGQEEKEKAGQENQLCPGLHAGLCGGGG